MSQQQFRRPAALISAAAVAAAIGFAHGGAGAGADAVGRAAPAVATPSAARSRGPGEGPAAPADSHAVCKVLASQDRLDYPLTRVSRHLEADRAIKIVAIGSSSTAGAGASSPEATYPSRLEAELTQHFLWHDVTVLNRGVNGEEAGDMLARFDTSVIDEKPDLVIWQTGTNSVLRDRPLDPEGDAAA